MPYKIERLANGQWVKRKADTGKIVSRHATKAKAVGSVLAELHRSGESLSAPPIVSGTEAKSLPSA